MSISSWPTGFPTPLREGYGYSQPELNQRTSFALGGRVRPLFSDGPDRFDVSVMLSAAQWRRFQGWHRYELANGSGWFTLPLFASGIRQIREARFTEAPRYELVAVSHARVTLPLETRTGTTISREEYEDLIGVIGFEDFVQTLITPSDTAIINPAAGDAAPSDPIPWGGLWLPYGGRIALEGDDGRAESFEFPPNTRFTGVIPRRFLIIGSDFEPVVYGLSHPTVTALPANSGNRIITVVPSDTVGLPLPAVGGLYTQSGGGFSYASTTGAGSAVLPPKRWLATPEFTRVNVAGTDAGFAAVAFVRAP